MNHLPSSIEVILHYYYSPEPHPREDAPDVRDAVVEFVREGLLKPTNAHSNGDYQITERGRVWVEMIRSTPYPESAWIDPRASKKAGV